jgi:hypothetical protein
MFFRTVLACCLAAVCRAASAEATDDLDKHMLKKCQAVAKELNKTRRAAISLDGQEPLVTWRAGCAERAPTGPGNVTALCQGKRTTAKGEQGVFFWEKSSHGLPNRGYFTCSG